MNSIEQMEVVRKTVETYYDKYGMQFGNFNEEERNHIINIGASIMCTKWDIGYPGGGFVQAFVSNDLIDTISRADSTCLKAIKFFTVLYWNVGMPQLA